MNDTPVIQLRDLRKRFGAVAAVDGVDLTIRPGEVVALLGAQRHPEALRVAADNGWLLGTA